MRKILELTPKVLRSGRARSQFDDDGGIWDDATGINPYLDNASYRGVIAITAAPTDITGSTVVDIPFAYAKDERGSTNFMYILGGSGHFYSVNVNKAVTDLRSGTPITSPSNGMFIFQSRHASAAATMFYLRESHIGTWDLSGTYATGWNDTAQAITSCAHHPTHKLFDTQFFGNKNALGRVYDDGTATPAYDTNALDFDKQETITALGDDGRYLIIATGRLVNDSYNTKHGVRIAWYLNGDSWEWETFIPNESAVRAIRRTPSGVYAICKNATYRIAYGLEPEPIATHPSDEAIPFDSLNYGHVQAAAVLGDGVIFGAKGTAIAEPEPRANRIVYSPLQGHTGDISLLVPDFISGTMFVGTRSSKLYWYDLTAAGTSASQKTTRYIDLGGYYHIGRIDVTLPNGIGASDSMAFEIIGTDGSATARTITQANFGDKGFVSIYLPAQVTTAKVKIGVTMSAGTPSFSALALYGEKATT